MYEWIMNWSRRRFEERTWAKQPTQHAAYLDRAAQGLEWIYDQGYSRDVLRPDLINVKTLDVASSTTCPLAQASGMPYRAAIREFGFTGSAWPYGFSTYLSGNESGNERALINAAWRRVLAADRQEHAVEALGS